MVCLQGLIGALIVSSPVSSSITVAVTGVVTDSGGRPAAPVVLNVVRQTRFLHPPSQVWGRWGTDWFRRSNPTLPHPTIYNGCFCDTTRGTDDESDRSCGSRHRRVAVRGHLRAPA